MSRRLQLLGGLILAFMFAAAAPGDDAKKHAEARKALVGVWRGYAVEGKGENPDRGPVKLELTITETTIHGIEIKADNRIDHGSGEFTLDLAADPKVLDASQKVGERRGRSYVGIYKLEGDTLHWCVSPQKKRPETFETSKGQFLIILKREKGK